MIEFTSVDSSESFGPSLSSLILQACYSIEYVRLADGPGPPCDVVVVNANIDRLSKSHLINHPRVGRKGLVKRDELRAMMGEDDGYDSAEDAEDDMMDMMAMMDQTHFIIAKQPFRSTFTQTHCHCSRRIKEGCVTMVKRYKDEEFLTDSYTTTEDSESFETVVKKNSDRNKPAWIFGCCAQPRTRSEPDNDVPGPPPSPKFDEPSSSEDSLRSFPRVAVIDQRTGYALVRSYKPRGHERRYKVYDSSGREVQMYTDVRSSERPKGIYPPAHRQSKDTCPQQPWLDTNTPIDGRDYGAGKRRDWQRQAEKFAGYRRNNVIQWLDETPGNRPKYL
ncbi:hypothetical protein WJX73_010616 [Symbiochloris irregularis]|uniref:Uncharacterized protein n=1 Tax=Symbiochloris irregularis TaxID=706552 RepID=A0AAW1PD62_9CHLO